MDPENLLKDEVGDDIKTLMRKLSEIGLNGTHSSLRGHIDIINIANYVSGLCSLTEFSLYSRYGHEVQHLTRSGLTDEEVRLFYCLRLGHKALKLFYGSVTEKVLYDRMTSIHEKCLQQASKEFLQLTDVGNGTLKAYAILANKPRSFQNRVFKLAIESKVYIALNSSTTTALKDFERQMFPDDPPINVRKVRTKLRRMQLQLEALTGPAARANGNDKIAENKCNKSNEWSNNKRNECAIPYGTTTNCSDATAYNLDEMPNTNGCTTYLEPSPPNVNGKTHVCDDAHIRGSPSAAISNRTIKASMITPQLRHEVGGKKALESIHPRFSVEEIRQIGNFENYKMGIPTDTLYLKNLDKKICQDDLEKIFDKFKDHICSIRVMNQKGSRMRGQAFIKFTNVELAREALLDVNGRIFYDRPLVIQFSLKGRK